MYIVTGVSRGLGKAIVEELLVRNEIVIGIGRKHNFSHPNFSFLECDLSEPNEIEKLKFPKFFDEVTLINNAGIIGNIKRLSDQIESDLQEVLNVNVTSPILLMKFIYSKIEDKSKFTVVNISSGAANRAIPSWAGYCASKAALNMLSETFYLEELEKESYPTVYTVSPGVIDTDMQNQIRTANPNDFSSLKNFIELKASHSLFSPDEAAKRLFKLLNSTFQGEISQDLRNF